MVRLMGAARMKGDQSSSNEAMRSALSVERQGALGGGVATEGWM